MNNSEVSHEAIVQSVDGIDVTVKMTVSSACAACHAKGLCGVSESEEKLVVAKNFSAAQFATGEKVRVELRQTLAVKAVIICYLLPLVVLLVAFFLMYLVCSIEWLNVLAALSATALYFFFVWLFHEKIEKNVTFIVSKIPQI
ncbi:MAG: SoxR reducing system RseC family protein [Bacteroidales bacterium]|nr:SoxR reducing system RseC family protein [Bacteroidales bacterium]